MTRPVASVVFHVPEVATEIDADLTQLLTAELALTPDRPGTLEARQARELIEQALAGGHREPIELTDPEHVAVLRALDNLRRAGKFHPDLEQLRSRLLNSDPPGPFTYSVRFADDPLRPEAAFFSYAGPFAEGDRLVLDEGEAWRVARVEEDAANARMSLIVRRFNRE